MTGNRGCTVYVGNLDERVSDRILYEILIQAGRIVDLHIPRDKETNRHKGFAFAEYESEEIAVYAVRLFSGLVKLCNRTLKFAISGQDKPSQNIPSPAMVTPKLRSHPSPLTNMEPTQYSSRFSNYAQQEPAPPGVVQPNRHASDISGNNYDYSCRVLGTTLDSINRSNSSRKLYDSRNTTVYPSSY